MDLVWGLLALVAIFGIPFVLSIYNFAGLFHEWKNKKLRNILWLLTFILGEIYTYLDFDFSYVFFDATWNQQLYNAQKHQPIWTGGIPTIVIITLVGVIGAGILASVDVNKLPPLASVLCISSMYLMLAIQIIWSIQCVKMIYESLGALYIAVPINLIFIVYTIIREKINQWDEKESHQEEGYGKNRLIKSINQCLMKSETWPFVAFVLAIPLLGVLLLVLILFGQEPDAIIKAWTETSGWTLSMKEAPQNLYYDEHYLCTAAAGGHRKVVKPIRMGERHGHSVIVNRQLLIANAFENVLEERTPKFHRAVRAFYDKYGFPVADLIRTNKIACDITYIIMKPLEWIFLLVLYMVDSNPENRIAVQYLPGKEKR